MGVQLQTSPGTGDLVLGNQLAVAPLDGLVLGGRVDPEPEPYSPLHLRDFSPDLAEVVTGLLDASPTVQRRSYRHLRDLPHPQVQKILRSFLPYGLFAQLCEIRVGQHLAVSGSGRAIAHHTPQGLIVQTLANQRILYRIPSQPTPCLLSADAQTLIRIVGKQERCLELWQGGKRQVTPKISGFKTVALAAGVGAIRVSILIAYRNGQVDRWHLPTGRIVKLLPPTRRGSLLALALSADGQTLATAHTGQRVRVIPPTGRPYTLTTAARRLALSVDGQTLATSHPNQGIRLWDVVRGQPLGMLRYPSPHIGAIGAMAFTPNGRVLATAIEPTHGPSQIQFWDLHQGDCIQTLTAAGGPITHMVFAAQGHALLTAHAQGFPQIEPCLRLWAVP